VVTSYTALQASKVSCLFVTSDEKRVHKSGIELLTVSIKRIKAGKNATKKLQNILII